MSSWTSINANIHISGVKKPFIIEAYNLPKDINDDDYDNFCNNYKNFKYKLFNKCGSKKLIKDYTKEEKLQLLTGARHNANHEILEAYLRAEYILKTNKEERK